MIRQQKNNVKVGASILVTTLSWYLAYILRFNYLPDAEQGLGLRFVILAPFLILITLRIFYSYKVFENQIQQNTLSFILTTIKANMIASILFVVILYFAAPEKISRLVLLFYFLISSFLQVLTQAFFKRHQILKENILIIADDESSLFDYFNRFGQIVKVSTKTFSIDDLKKHNISLVVMTLSESSKNILQLLKNELVQIIYFPTMEKSYLGSKHFEIEGFPVLQLNVPIHRDFDLLIKRIFDFVCVLVGLIVISPLLVLIAILVKITSPGPVFYYQERMGLDGSVFKMWKFRSMKVSQEDKPGWTVENDPRRTKFGAFLRATSLDELPQLWNVLVGDMSLVGPRPEQPFFVDKFKQEVPTYMLRHRMKAGITGWAQINGWRGNTSIEKRVECDIYYIKNWSLFLDIKIIFLTFWRGFINKNAY